MADTRVQPNDQGLFVCPECGREFPQAKGLGAHRRAAHKVVGTSASATRTRTTRMEPRNGAPGVPVFAREAKGTTFPWKNRVREVTAPVLNSTTIQLAREVEEADIALAEAVQRLQDHLNGTYGPRK